MCLVLGANPPGSAKKAVGGRKFPRAAPPRSLPAMFVDKAGGEALPGPEAANPGN